MPPKIQFTKGDLLRAAFHITRTQGIAALNARAIARELGCSTQPIFRAFRSMDEIHQEMLRMAMETYSDYIAGSTKLAPMPYMGSGMAYLLFAKEERELFKLLFMRDRMSTSALDEPNDVTMDYVIKLVMKNTGFTRERALDFHYHLWIFTHGLASMIATRFLDLPTDEMMRLLSEQYQATRKLYGLPPVPDIGSTISSHEV